MIFSFNARYIAGVFLSLTLAACNTPQTKALRGAVNTNFEAHAELSEVAFFPQEENQCGPASLAMVFKSAGLNIEPEQLKDSLYLPDKQGSLQVEMLAATRLHGLLAYLLQPELQDVLAEISAGNPVVVLQNLGLSWHPVWHYAVVIGYDLDNEEIIFRSGSNQRLLMPFKTFEHTWARSQYWAMVALPPDRVPKTARPESYLQSITALKHSSPATDVNPAYTAAMQRWPNNLLVQIAAGNHAYGRGELNLAQQIFQLATQDHPDSAAAFNNLAQTLSDQGLHDAALKAILRALEIGGPLEPVMRSTRLEIEQRKRAAQQGGVK